jgi:hypothetical protein
MSVVIAFTQNGIIVADGLAAAQRVADNAGQAITSKGGEHEASV